MPFVIKIDTPHDCVKPLTRSIEVGSLWICNECGRYYALRHGNYQDTTGKIWVQVDQHEAAKMVNECDPRYHTQYWRGNK